MQFSANFFKIIGYHTHFGSWHPLRKTLDLSLHSEVPLVHGHLFMKVTSENTLVSVVLASCLRLKLTEMFLGSIGII